MGDQPHQKSGKLTPEQISALIFQKRLDFTSDDWLELYLSEFPKEEQRDVNQLRKLLGDGKLVMHETRDASGKLLTWSISQHFPAKAGSDEPSFWLGCWTVTRREAQSIGIGRVHFPKVVEALRSENPNYLGRFTEIESTSDLGSESQPVRRAKFYQTLGLLEVAVPYEMARFQPHGSTEHVMQAQMVPKVKAQLLISPFSDAQINGKQIASVIKRIYVEHYSVVPCDPYIAQRVRLINKRRKSYLVPLLLGDERKIGAKAPRPKPVRHAKSAATTKTRHSRSRRSMTCGRRR